jgi:hypothetical protein
MAPAAQKDLISRLADAGESAMKTLGDAPGADRFLGAATALRDRLDELQKRVRGLEALERKVDRLSKDGSASSTRKAGARKTTSTKSSGSGSGKKS